MKVLYYTFTPFLDCALELINVLKKHVELHVIIEIAPDTQRSNILDMRVLPEKGKLLWPDALLGSEELKAIMPYFQGASSVQFMAYTHKRSFSFVTLKESWQLLQFVRQLQPDVIHFEGFSVRSLGLIPFIRKKQVFYTLHDPLPHSGEHNWRLALAKFLNFGIAKGYFFYSDYSRKLFAGYYKKQQHKKQHLLKLYPYSIFNRFEKNTPANSGHILFFGRISPYKGIETLLKAIPSFLEVYPREKLLIAGKTIAGYAIEDLIPTDYKSNIQVIEKHLPNDELVELIRQAKVVVCPYKDATQSGVLMTAHALQVPVIASDTGAFSEYIEHDVNGLLFPVDDHQALASCLVRAFENSRFEAYRVAIASKYKTENWEDNIATLLEAYQPENSPYLPARGIHQLESQKVS